MIGTEILLELMGFLPFNLHFVCLLEPYFRSSSELLDFMYLEKFLCEDEKLNLMDKSLNPK